MPLKDIEKRKDYNKKYKEVNREKIASYQKEYMKKYLEKNPRPYKSTSNTEWVVKRRELSRKDFEQWRLEKRRRQGGKSSREIYQRNKIIIDNCKLSHLCSCGENDIACLEFHHRDPSKKKFQISNEGKHSSIKVLNEEIAKCDILCKNCHTKLHNRDIEKVDYEQLIADIDIILATKLDKFDRRRIWGKKQKTISRIYVRDYKIEHNCKNCGEENPNCLVFHHRDPSTKKNTIPQLYKYGTKTVQREIDKCDLLCHNCHSKTHHKNFLLESDLL